MSLYSSRERYRSLRTDRLQAIFIFLNSAAVEFTDPRPPTPDFTVFAPIFRDAEPIYASFRTRRRCASTYFTPGSRREIAAAESAASPAEAVLAARKTMMVEDSPEPVKVLFTSRVGTAYPAAELVCELGNKKIDEIYGGGNRLYMRSLR